MRRSPFSTQREGGRNLAQAVVDTIREPLLGLAKTAPLAAAAISNQISSVAFRQGG